MRKHLSSCWRDNLKANSGIDLVKNSHKESIIAHSIQAKCKQILRHNLAHSTGVAVFAKREIQLYDQYQT